MSRRHGGRDEEDARHGHHLPRQRTPVSAWPPSPHHRGDKNAAKGDYDADADDGYLTDEEDIARRGGVTADDRVEVQPWIEKEERFSFVSSDPRAIDLDSFKHLAKRGD